MQLKRALLSILLLPLISFASVGHDGGSSPDATVLIMGAPVALNALTPTEQLSTAQPAVVTLAPVPLAPLPDYAAAMTYYRSLSPRVLLLDALKSQVAFDRLAPKIQRESHWTCGTNNRHSSAAGLGQTLKTQSRVDFLASLGFTWEDVRGPDCLADVLLIAHLYAACGLGDWTPPYRCLKPVY